MNICWQSKSKWSCSCLTLCDLMDCSLPGFSVHGIFQTRVPEWVAFSFSRGSSRPRDQTQISCIVGRHFTLLSMLIITFLPRSKCLLISWLQSPYAVIFKPKKVKSIIFPHLYADDTTFMADSEEEIKSLLKKGKDIPIWMQSSKE